jgi:glycosyltransferase involved in cell wall biosynthesis
MRILHIATRHIKGGAARNLAFTLNWELQHGHDVQLAVGPDSDLTIVPPDVALYVVPHLVRSPRPAADAHGLREIARLLERARADVVHTHQSKAGILGRLAARGRVPLVVHSIHMAAFGPGYGRAASLLYAAAERFCARFTDFFVPVGEDLRTAYLAAGIGRPERYHVIHSPLGVEAFLSARMLTQDERAAIRQRLALPAEAQVITAAGLLEPRKRFDLIIGQLAPLLRSGRAQLLLAGDGPAAAALRARAEALDVAGAVRLLGYVDDLPQLFAVSDLFVHASSAEGVPQVVVQALAAGVPVVATTVEGLGDLPEGTVTVVDRNGDGLLPAVAGILSRPADPPVAAELLSPWTEAAVAARLAAFHARLDEELAGAWRARPSTPRLAGTSRPPAPAQQRVRGDEVPARRA